MGKTLEDELESHGVHVINPFTGQKVEGFHNKNTHIKIITDMTLDDCNNIAQRDLKLIDECDGMVVMWPHYEIPSVGIPMEVMYQFITHSDKPIFSYVPDKWYKNHPWVRFTSDLVTDDLPTLVKDICAYYDTMHVELDAPPKHGGHTHG